MLRPATVDWPAAGVVAQNRVPEIGRQGRASIFKIEEVNRHKSLEALTAYVCDAQAFTDHAGEDFA